MGAGLGASNDELKGAGARRKGPGIRYGLY